MGVALEVNGNPHRMDIPDTWCRQARQAGVPVAVNTDAHAPEHLRFQEYGLVTARRGWIEPGDVVNCQPWTVFADRRRDRMRSHGISLDGLRLPAASDRALYPATPTADPSHWPAESEAAPPPDPGADDGDLAAHLTADPLDEDLAQRLDDWLRNGGDPAIEAALATLGENPMQVAFNLLHG